MRKISLLWSLFSLLVLPVCLLSKEVDSLESRVNAYYKLVQNGRWDQAEQYVVKSSRKAFQSEGHGKILEYRIAEISPEEGKKSAIVQVAVKVFIKAVPKPVEVPTFTRWKLQSGKWCLDPSDPPPNLADKFKSCYWDRLAKKLPARVKFDKETIDFGVVKKGTVLNLRFPYLNSASSEVSLKKVYVNDPVKDLSQAKVVKTGEKGEVVIELDTSPFGLAYDQTVFVEFQPINECSRLRIKGRILDEKGYERRNPTPK